MKRMVDDFREYARLPMPELKPLNINELITEMLGLYESSNAKIILNLQHNLPLVIGDATQLRQVIHNLLRNAEDALESKINDEKIITISTEISDEVIATNSKYIKLQIADNGGADANVVVSTCKQRQLGYNALTGNYEDLFETGVVDPAKVTRSALENAASIAGMLLTTESAIVDKVDNDSCKCHSNEPVAMM